MKWRLRQLTGLEQDKLRLEYDEIVETIADLKDILSNEPRRYQIIKDELIVIRDKYGDERRSEIEYAGGDMRIEDMIPDAKVVVTISNAGYLKRTNLDEYKVQTEEVVDKKERPQEMRISWNIYLLEPTTNTCCSLPKKAKSFGCVFLKYQKEENSKGRAIQNLIHIEQDDKVKAFLVTRDLKDEDYVNSHYVIMATKKGQVKKTSLEQYSRPRTNGINAITIREDDELLEAKSTTGDSQVMLALKSGKRSDSKKQKNKTYGENGFRSSWNYLS